MLQYFILTIYILIISFIKFKNIKLQLILCFLPFLIFIATRVGWTADYYNYENIFHEHHSWKWTDYIFYSFNKFEPGFYLLNKILPSYRAVLVVVSFLYTSSIFLVFYKYIPSRYYFLAFILWFYNPTFFESFAAVRSSIVLAFFIYAVHLKLNGRIIYSILLMIIAGFFHRSSFFIIPFFIIPIDFIKKYFYITCATLIIIFIILILSPSVIIDRIIYFLSDSQFASYTTYIITESYGLGYILFTIFRVIFIFYLLYLVKRNIIVDKYLWFVILIVFYYILSSLPDIQIGYRFNVFLKPFIIVLQIYVLNRDKTILSRIYILLTLAYMLFYFTSFFNHPNYIPFFLNYKSSLFN